MTASEFEGAFRERNGTVGMPPRRQAYHMPRRTKVILAMLGALTLNVSMGDTLGAVGTGAVFALFGAWAVGMLVFRSTPLEEVALERIYGPACPMISIDPSPAPPSKWLNDYNEALAAMGAEIDPTPAREFERQLMLK